EQLDRSEIPQSSLPEEWNDELDYVLALSLQSESNPHRKTAAKIPRDFWDTKESRPSAHLRHNLSFADNEVTMLPCEFCEELCPAEELILHQTGCNPESAFASFSKRSSFPRPWEYRDQDAVGSSSWSTLPSTQPQAVQGVGDIMIPCEFCGIQLEEEILFHHQHHCDLRPASPAATIPSRRESRESPEPRRRSRHQGV
ncbi:TRAD1 protein, partial [Smithornis capensis]|nr:TRAD1 protein [Smithornis capensis]